MLIIGIAGGTGSGKTTVVKKISERLHNKVVVIPQTPIIKTKVTFRWRYAKI